MQSPKYLNIEEILMTLTIKTSAQANMLNQWIYPAFIIHQGMCHTNLKTVTHDFITSQLYFCNLFASS